jgi:nitrate/nitrite-specific signal transduction histidine kinase
MNRPWIEGRFPSRIGRSLTWAAAFVVAAVLVFGGTSLALAVRISLNNDAVTQEYDHILRLDKAHSLFDDLTFELHQMDSTGRRDRASEALLIHDDLVEQLDVLEATHRGEVSAAEQRREQVTLGEIRRRGEEGRALAQRLAAGSGRLTEADFDWLNRATHEVPRHAETVAESHRARIGGLLRSSQNLLQLIVALYVAFIFVGGALVLAAGLAARRAITVPLEKLAQAAQGIADGRLETRVRVASGTEVGLVSHAFNLMADRLLEQRRELQRANQALEDKVRETQALYRIGTEIARLQQLDRVLQSVVDKARELLRADAAALCLFSPVNREPVAQATSGPPEAFRAPERVGRCEPLAEGCERRDTSPLLAPDHARGHLATTLRLGDDDIGVLYVGTREPREFSDGEVELLAGLATQAAVAIERTRLSEEVRSLAAVEERERLAREMHDGLAQSLGLLHLKLQSALSRGADSPALAQDLREMVQVTAGAYEDVRQSIFGLRTFVSRGLGIVATLTEYLHEFSAHTGIAVELEVPGGPVGLVPPATEVQAVRIIQEALTNVRKHAATSRARVRIQREGAWLRVAVEDEGVGWDGAAAQNGLHFGLQMMRERAEGLGGRLEVHAAPGRGTRVVATLPGGVA